MILTWPQQHPINWQFKQTIKNCLTHSSQIHSWMFDDHQSNVLLGFRSVGQGIFEPISLNLPHLLKQHLDQFQTENIPVAANSDPLRTPTVKNSPPNQDQANLIDNLINRDPKDTDKQEEILQKLPALEIWRHFDKIDDPRADANQRHKLMDIITIAILAVICGADNWVQIEEFGISKREWLSTFLELPRGIPSHDTFNRLFARLDPDQFRSGFISWVNSIREVIPGEVIAIDGKKNRRTHDKKLGRKAIHMVSAWASQNKLVFGQVKVDDKSNEITAIPELLRMLYIKGCIITIDAMGCQKDIAKCIVEQEADYVLALKGNHKNLHNEVKEVFASILAGNEINFDYFNTVDKNHGRIEIRQCWTAQVKDLDLTGSSQWANFRTIALVIDERIIDQKKQKSMRYFISSLPANAEKILSSVRSHWTIENSLHWVLDMAFKEDQCRLRTGHGAQNFAILRHLALSLLQQEDSKKRGIETKRRKAGWNTEYLLKVLELAS